MKETLPQSHFVVVTTRSTGQRTPYRRHACFPRPFNSLLFLSVILSKKTHFGACPEGASRAAQCHTIRGLLGLELRCMGPLLPEKKSRDFNPITFLGTIGEGRKNLTFAKKQAIFAQGDAADSVFYIQKGKVMLTVVSKTGDRKS